MIALFYDTWEYKQYARYGDTDTAFYKINLCDDPQDICLKV